jgi:hypothetical protein
MFKIQVIVVQLSILSSLMKSDIDPAFLVLFMEY